MTPSRVHHPLARGDTSPITRLAVGTAALALLFASAVSRPAGATGLQYLSPSPGARYVSALTSVVFREGRTLDPTSLAPGLVSVAGEASGAHGGRLVVARDGRTLVFRPDAPFALGEAVNVTLRPGLRAADGTEIPPVAFTFEVGRMTRGDQLQVLATLETDGGNAVSAAPEPAALDVPCDALPSGFPPFNIRVSNNPDPGSLFLSPYSGMSGNIVIIDNTGQPLFYRHFTGMIHDFAVQPNGLLTYFTEAPPTGMPKFFALDRTFAVVDSFETGNGYVPDTHDLLLLPDGHFLIMAYDPQPVRMDLVVPGGDPEAIVIGLVIQELDADRNVVFQWRSWDHFEITDFASASGSLTAGTIDYVHGNSIDLMPDGNLLLSSRHMNELTKIDRQTGDIMWRMGPHAKHNDFTFVNDARGFSHQHDARWLPNGHLTLFDNGNYISPVYSRMVEYQVDEVDKVATLVLEYAHTPKITTTFMGGARRLPSGKTLIGWGGAYSYAKLTELNPDGSVSLELGAAANVQSYRAVRASWRNGLLVADEHFEVGVASLGQAVTRPLRVGNGGSEAVTIGCAVSMNPQFSVTTPLPVTIPPGGEALLEVTFTPAALGSQSGTIYLRVPGATQFVAQDVSVTGTGNAVPDCSHAFATPTRLWPPNHRLESIHIGGVTDPEGDAIAITATGVFQNEPLDGTGDGSTCPDAVIENGVARLRAERGESGGGRAYAIAFRAEDAHGAVSTGVVWVCVPHDAGRLQPIEPLSAGKPEDPAPDPPWTPDGPEYLNAVGPCPAQLDGESNDDPTPPRQDPETATLSLRAIATAGNLTTVEYSLAADGNARLTAYDLSGRRVRTLLDGRQTAGVHRLEWGTSDLPAGIYFCRLHAGGKTISRVVRVIR